VPKSRPRMVEFDTMRRVIESTIRPRGRQSVAGRCRPKRTGASVGTKRDYPVLRLPRAAITPCGDYPVR